jgi:hypothetical protein
LQGFVSADCGREVTGRYHRRRMESAEPKGIMYDSIDINHNIFHHVANDTNSYEMWQKLVAMYKRKTTMNKASAIKRLAKLEHRDGSIECLPVSYKSTFSHEDQLRG